MIDLYTFRNHDTQYRDAGLTYAAGTWGYTVLRTAYSEEADALWSVALERLKLWVTQYLVHLSRLAFYRRELPDPSVNVEIGRRFALEIVEDRDSEVLRKFPSLVGITQQDRDSLVEVFEAWARGTVDDMDSAVKHNPRFSDFIVIDEDSLRSLAALPDETPHVNPVPMAERRARMPLYEDAYVWLFDAWAVKRFEELQKYDDWEGPEKKLTGGDPERLACYGGLMKIQIEYLYTAWKGRLRRIHDEEWIFTRIDARHDRETKWYFPS